MNNSTISFLFFFSCIKTLPEMGGSRLLLMLYKMEDSVAPSQTLVPRLPVSLCLWPSGYETFHKEKDKVLTDIQATYSLCNYVSSAKARLDYEMVDKETGRKDCKQPLLSCVLDKKEKRTNDSLLKFLFRLSVYYSPTPK